MEKIRSIAQPELGWDDERWAREEAAYHELWKRYYSPL
jgi:glycerol-3-phosphate dehydrogenase